MNKTYMAPSAGEMRASNAEREPVIEHLKQAYAEGRLDHGEFDLRVHLAMTAKTRAELAAITRDLVPPVAPAHRPDVWTGPEPTGEDRMLAAAAHAAGGLTTFVGPLVLLLLSGKRSEYVRRHAAEALNFQLTLLLLTIVTFGLGGIVYAVAWIVCVVAAVVAVSGKPFRYPWTLRIIR
ncbi:DUF1707 and DUF4870 domain-containing protein [Actinomadura alba]|nr:DUF1707 and DUF4870 domain-containing protein [Actinomadura alba]